jgi:hypothetical protein
MKNKLFNIVAGVTLLILPTILSAQEPVPDFREKMLMGLKAGVNSSNVYDTQGEKYTADPQMGFAGGVFLSVPIGKYLGIQPELLFSQKGYKSKGTYLGSAYNLSRTSNYLDIPILFALKPSEYFTILAGPQYSFLMKQTDVFSNSFITAQQETNFNNDNIRKNTLCFTGGIDFTFQNFVLSGRVGWDLTENNGDGTSTAPRYKNVWYQATLGFRL